MASPEIQFEVEFRSFEYFNTPMLRRFSNEYRRISTGDKSIESEETIEISLYRSYLGSKTKRNETEHN